MEHNPYAPPASSSGALEIPAAAQMPSQVAIATRLLWITVGLGLVNSAVEWTFLASTAPAAVVLTMLVFTFGILAILTLFISRGRNWARIAYLVMFILGLPIVLLQFPITFTRSPISGLIGLFQLLLQLGALYLIFFGPGRSWFRRSAAGKATVA